MSITFARVLRFSGVFARSFLRILLKKEEGMEGKKWEEVLAEVHRNCQLALRSIADILPETQEEALREELMRQHEDYEKMMSAIIQMEEKGLSREKAKIEAFNMIKNGR